MKICLLFVLFVLPGSSIASSWNNLNCPAPRAPDNGLSFIFRNGELVHFRCHPGYQMIGKSVAHCVNNVWTHPAPECIPIRKWPHPSNQILSEGTANYHNRHSDHKWKAAEKQRQLFNWGDRDASKQNVYGDGPKRLPLINGIWPPQDHADQVLALGPQSTPGPRALVKEEIDIAELRNKQLEELKKQRYNTDHTKGKRRQGRKKNKNRRKNAIVVDESIPRETILSLGATEDGQAFSVAHTKPLNETIKPRHHKHRHHRISKKKKNIEMKKPIVNSYDPAGYFNNIVYSRKSRVNTGGIPQYRRSPFSNDVAEFRRRPVEQIEPSQIGRSLSNSNQSIAPAQLIRNNTRLSVSNFDASCVDPMFRRHVPKIAPQIRNGFVYRYETKKNKLYPFNAYMVVKYRCFNGYSFAVNHEQTLHCKKGSWVGATPRCVQ